jgi:hypothetical protein
MDIVDMGLLDKDILHSSPEQALPIKSAIIRKPE